jgi:8-oxo-dGTP pyrophosphatase MutT (NUDIX family)
MSLDFNTFVSKLAARMELPLPGPAAHEPMRATPSGQLRPDFQHKLPPKPGSVLILLYPDEGAVKFPLTKRAEYNGAHSGQVSFPGGKSEGSETRTDTALREGEEEIGISRSNITVIGKLTEFFVIPSNFIITPIVAYQSSKPVFRPDPFEVVRVLEARIDDILDEGSIHIKEITAAKVYQLMAPHFIVEDEIVWGATAMMLNEFRFVVKDVLSN